MFNLNADADHTRSVVEGQDSRRDVLIRISGAAKIALAKLFALSAAIDYELLEERDEQGTYKFRRGRQKYYGLGSLVVFFAVFSGYGMGHMLSSMSQMSTLGATLAGFIWGLFQWSLERQILISIRSDDALWRKIFGLTWRSCLALMSASVMVYPFFVESNRAEINVKVGEISQQRMLNAQEATEKIANLPRIRQEQENQHQLIQNLELAMAQEPPDILGYRQKAKQCWSKFQIENAKLSRQLGPSLLLRERPGVDLALDARISALEQKRDAAKSMCSAADTAIVRRVNEWHQMKQQEYLTATNQQKQLRQQLQLASERQQALVAEQDVKINLASRSGFAADFFAVASLITEDKTRRFQLIWWLTWFVAIELVAILIKFGTQTELDIQLLLDEKKFVHSVEQEYRLWQEQQATNYLREFSQQQAEQAAWRNQTQEDAVELINLELSLSRERAKQIMKSKADLALSTTLLEAGIEELRRMNELKFSANQDAQMQSSETLLEQMCEQAQRELQARYMKAFGY